MKRDYRAFDWARETALVYLGKPYIWGGDDPMCGFDCSGFIIEILRSAGKLTQAGDWTAAELFKLYEDKEVPGPDKGHLVFVEREGNIRHVEFCLDHVFTIGASGGGPHIISQKDAIRFNAYVKIRPLSRLPKDGLKFVDPFAIDEKRKP